jgi:hypothetical protein
MFAKQPQFGKPLERKVCKILQDRNYCQHFIKNSILLNWILNESEAFICKAFQGEAIVELCFALNNAADGSLRLALRVRINEIK